MAPPTPERRPKMANRAWKHWVVALILAAALWAAGSSRAEEKAQLKAFNSAVGFDVYAVIGEEGLLLGRTPSEWPVSALLKRPAGVRCRPAPQFQRSVPRTCREPPGKRLAPEDSMRNASAIGAFVQPE